MAVRVNLSKPTSFFLEKILKTQQNLSKPSPTLWNDHKRDEDIEKHKFDFDRVHTLTLNHPILRILESSQPTLQEFNQNHTQLVVSGLIQHSLAVGRAIKKLCSTRSLISHGAYLFSHLEEPDAFMCNTIVKAYVGYNDLGSAIGVYYRGIVEKGVRPNPYTFPVLLKVCAEMGWFREGEKSHGRVVKFGFGDDVFVRNSMIYMYASLQRMRFACKVFDESPNSDLVTWNSMINGYIKNGDVGIARDFFNEMPERDIVSWNTMIAGYMSIGDMDAAEEVFERMGVRDIVSWNSMIDGYARIGNVFAAREFFKRMPDWNLTSWNVMLALYVRSKYYGECLRLFDKMIGEGDVKPDEATLVSVLIACGSLGVLDKGKWVHSYIKENSRIVADVLLSTNLLTMYAKCGAMNLAREIFDEMPKRNIVSWNSMITGYGMHGENKKALEMFSEMGISGVNPNEATFVCILSACTHGGMVLEGWRCFDLMERVYKIKPKVEHYGCMVDLLGRAGLIQDSEELIKKMPTEAGPALWGALLSACRIHPNFELAKLVGERLIASDCKDVGPYVTLSNIYAMEGKWDEVEKVRNIMREKRLQKFAGFSLVDFVESGKCDP